MTANASNCGPAASEPAAAAPTFPASAKIPLGAARAECTHRPDQACTRFLSSPDAFLTPPHWSEQRRPFPPLHTIGEQDTPRTEDRLEHRQSHPAPSLPG